MKRLIFAALALFGLNFAAAADARADWREAILGQKIYDSSSMGGWSAPKARPAPARKYVAAAAPSYDTPRPARRASSRSGLDAPSAAFRKPVYGGSSSSETGVASYYWQPQPVASGGRFNPNAMTAAHKTLPFGTKVRVTDNSTGRSVVVTINDRGPYIKGRIIDLSKAAAGSLGIQSRGIARVSVARV